jgi:hypothetical protein
MQTGKVERTSMAARQRWFLLGLFLVFFALSVQYSIKALANRSAILRWRDQIAHLDDENIYQRYTYPNPPIMALLLKPIVQLPPMAGSLCWFYLKLSMTIAAFYWAFRLIASPQWPFPAWAKGLAILLSLRPIMGDLSHANVNLFILFLLTGALYAYCRGRDWLAGLTLALAIACKVTPALFIPYFLWKRAWKTLAGCCLGLVLFFLLVPALYLGSTRNLELLESWVKQMVTPYLVEGNVTSEHQNQSLPGVVFRLCTHSPSFEEKGEPLQYDNLLDVDVTYAKWFVKGCMALFAGLIVWSCRTPTMPRGGWRLAAEFSLVVLGMLLFSERTWKHHCVTLLLPFTVIAYYLAVMHPAPGLRNYLIATLGAVILLMSSTSTTLVPAFDAKMAQVYGAYVWVNVILVAAMIVLLRCQIEKMPGRLVPVPIFSQALTAAVLLREAPKQSAAWERSR